MQVKSRNTLWALLPAILMTSLVIGSTATPITASQLGNGWAEASFAASEHEQRKLFESTLELAESAVSVNSGNPEILAWAGIIQASYAGTIKGLSALRHAKKARKLLTSAMDHDPEALDGGARSTLGVLYYKVPPWPIGFGNKKRAEALLSESATKYPSNLNAQFFYGEFLFDQKRQPEARRVFEKALAIPVRSGFVQVDTARVDKIEQYLEKL